LAKTLRTLEKTLKNSQAMEDYFRRLFFVPIFAVENAGEGSCSGNS
jgi:hypothetical protein